MPNFVANLMLQDCESFSGICAEALLSSLCPHVGSALVAFPFLLRWLCWPYRSFGRWKIPSRILTEFSCTTRLIRWWTQVVWSIQSKPTSTCCLEVLGCALLLLHLPDLRFFSSSCAFRHIFSCDFLRCSADLKVRNFDPFRPWARTISRLDLPSRASKQDLGIHHVPILTFWILLPISTTFDAWAYLQFAIIFCLSSSGSFVFDSEIQDR